MQYDKLIRKVENYTSKRWVAVGYMGVSVLTIDRRASIGSGGWGSRGFGVEY